MIAGKPLMPHAHPRTQRFAMRAPPPLPWVYRYRAVLLVLAGLVLMLFITLVLTLVAHLTHQPYH